MSNKMEQLHRDGIDRTISNLCVRAIMRSCDLL